MGESDSRRSATVKIRILDKDYQVSCPPGDRGALLEAARYLDEQMRRVRRRGDIHGAEIAVMAALNITHDLLAGGGADEDVRAAASRGMRELGDRIDQALTAAGRTGS